MSWLLKALFVVVFVSVWIALEAVATAGFIWLVYEVLMRLI